MADFLTKAQTYNEEKLELLGETITVRGISIGELIGLAKVKKGEEPKDNVALGSELIARCCFTKDGKPLIPHDKIDLLKSFSPAVYNALNDAVSRVNGSTPGNSKATDSDGLLSD